MFGGLPSRQQDLLEQAAQALHNETGMRLEVDNQPLPGSDPDRYDVVLRLEDQHFCAIVKPWAHHAKVGVLIKSVKDVCPFTPLLVADYVNPNMAEELRAQNVQFIDTAGNAFLNLPRRFVLIKGHKKSPLDDTPKKVRAFTTAGLKVIFSLLIQPELVKATYRDMADSAGVALGTVNGVISDLKQTGFIVERKGGTRRIANYRKLANRWVEAYPEQLRPKLLLGQFVADDPHWWDHFDMTAYQSYWGGEIAAAKMTSYINPEVATIYAPRETLPRLVLDARLRKTPRAEGQPGLVKIYQPFWKRIAPSTGIAPSLLVYADLLASGEPRNIETARIIYDETLDYPED